MRWRGERESDNVEDRRGQSSGIGGLGGGGNLGGLLGLLLQGKRGIAIIGIIIVAGFFGVDLMPLFTGGQSSGIQSQRPPSAEEDEMAKFTSVTLGLTEDTWKGIFQKMGKIYKEPKLVLYQGGTRTACGYGQAAMGPFYCPGDETVYIDVAFYQDMKTKLGGGGDFAQGYVIAHEVGHHVQNLLGINEQVRQLQAGASKKEANALSVKMELQADCFAGIWGDAMKDKGILDIGDVEQALNTAQAIGDDRLQQQSSGHVVPDSFTHGTSQQRYEWFKRGYDTGDVAACDTFK